MAKRRNRGTPQPPDDDRSRRMFDEGPVPRRKELREQIERCIADYDSAVGAIDLSCLGIGPGDVKWTVSQLRLLDRLTTLRINNNEIGASGATEIAENLKTLAMLDVSVNCIGVDGAEAIATSLCSLTALDIGGNAIGDTGAEAIATSLPCLTNLQIGGNSITDVGAEAIVLSLPCLRNLNVTANEISDIGALAIANSLPMLTTLEIGANAIGDEGAKAIAAKLFLLEALDVSVNDIRELGATSIAESLVKLRFLDVGSNPINEGGVKAVLKSTAPLNVLCARSIQAGDVWENAISESALPLQLFDVGGSLIGDRGAIAISRVFGKLAHLYVGGNAISEAGVWKFAECLTFLTHLNIGNNPVSDIGTVIRLLECLRSNGNLAGVKSWISVFGCPLQWPSNPTPVSDEILRENDPIKLRDLLLSVRDHGADISAAGVAFIGRTEHGKTHAARWIGAEEYEYANLRQLIPRDQRTWGYDRSATSLKPSAHGQSEIGDLYLTIVDVGGHREQLNSAANLVYMNARRSVFVLVVKAGESFREGNWGRYYLRLVASLRARKRSFEDGRLHTVHELDEAGPDERIPVLLLVTHSKGNVPVDLPTAEQLRADYPLLDIIAMEQWEAPEGDQYLPALHAKLGQQLGKLQALRGRTVGFIRQVMDRVRDEFELDRPEPRDVPPKVGSISVKDFRKLCDECVEMGKTTPAEQESAVRELASFGYLARTGRTYADDARLLNPRFVNHYLFEKVLRDDRTRNNDGYMQQDWFEDITRHLSQAELIELQTLMHHCLITFAWEQAGGVSGMFVPDLLPARAENEHPSWPDAKWVATLEPVGFFSEDAFFRFIAHQKPHLRCAHTVTRNDGSVKEVRLFRNECVLGDDLHGRTDCCKALVKADVIAERIVIEVRAEDLAEAKSFADGLIASLKMFGHCDFRTTQMGGVFNELADDFRPRGETVARARRIVNWFAIELRERQRSETFSGPEIVEFFDNGETWDLVRRSVNFLCDSKRRILEHLPDGGYQLTVDIGRPFVDWVCKSGGLK